MAQIGYARVSTVDKQSTDLQTDALTAAGCERIFTDAASGAREDRKGLSDALNYARSGDIILVWRLDRLGRSLRHLIDVVNGLEERGVGLRSLTENIDTSSPGGRLIFHIFAALAECEKDIIRSRVSAGLVAARARGRIGGRPAVVDATKLAAMKAMVEQGMSASEVCKALGVSRATYFRYKAKEGA
ncbi:MAG: recombinase family protein [Capsulimonadaceae bacterium]|nr:recombinase family protein [Capsulimonadaceae bacterium]